MLNGGELAWSILAIKWWVHSSLRGVFEPGSPNNLDQVKRRRRDLLFLRTGEIWVEFLQLCKRYNFCIAQIAQFAAIGMLRPLTFAVVDTTRRLWIVVAAGFILQGELLTVRPGLLFLCLRI